MDVLLGLIPLKSSNASELRQLYDIIEIHIRNLHGFDILPENYGPVLISIITSKLPSDICLEISRQMPAGKWKITDLMENFKQELVSRERCESISAQYQMHNIKRPLHYILKDTLSCT